MTVNKAVGFVFMFTAILISELKPNFLKDKAEVYIDNEKDK